MYLHVQRLINEIEADEPDPAAANALQEGWAVSSARCGR
jgi:Mn-containing catalase